MLANHRKNRIKSNPPHPCSQTLQPKYWSTPIPQPFAMDRETERRDRETENKRCEESLGVCNSSVTVPGTASRGRARPVRAWPPRPPSHGAQSCFGRRPHWSARRWATARAGRARPVEGRWVGGDGEVDGGKKEILIRVTHK